MRTRAALVAMALLAACGKSDTPAAFGRPPSPVLAAAAAVQDVPLYLDEIGRAVASEVVTVIPRVSGEIKSIGFVDGTDLAPKAPLFTIDSRPYDAALAEAKALLASANAGVTAATASRDTALAHVAAAKGKHAEALARSLSGQAMAEAARGDSAAAASDAARAVDDQRRMEALTGSGAVSDQEVTKMRAEAVSAAGRLDSSRRREAAAVAQATEAVAAAKSAEEAVAEAVSQVAEAEARMVSAAAAVEQATAAVETARLNVEFCSILSPIAGRASRRLVDVGNVVAAGTTPLLSIQRYDPIHVEFTVTETDLSAVQRNMANRTLQASVHLPEEPEVPRDATLVFLDNRVDEATGTVRLRVKAENADGKFWPGRFVHIRLVLDTLKGAVLVPAGSTRTSAHGPFVFVVKGDGTAEMRPVQVGQRQGDLVVIQSGLAAGETVVVEGQVGLWPGAKVVVAQPPPSPPAAQSHPGSKATQ